MSNDAPKRRWFRFSLRTLFVVVTVFACALGWTYAVARRVWERERLIEEVGRNPIGLVSTHAPSDFTDLPSAPWSIRLFGGRTVGRFILPASQYTEADRQRIQDLFPEAKVELE